MDDVLMVLTGVTFCCFVLWCVGLVKAAVVEKKVPVAVECPKNLELSGVNAKITYTLSDGKPATVTFTDGNIVAVTHLALALEAYEKK